MIALLNSKRSRLLAGVVAVALTQLVATIAVAQALHGPFNSGWAVAVGAAILAFGCEILLRRLSEGLGLDYVSAVRDALFRHLMAVDPAVIARRRHGAMLQSFVGDLTALRQWVAEGIMRAILAMVALIGLLTWLCLASPRLGWTALGIVGAVCVASLVLLNLLSGAVQRVRRERGRVSAFASERLAASATVLACARTGSEARRLARRVERLNSASMRRAWLTGMLRAMPHLATTAMVIAAVLLGGSNSAGAAAGQVLVIGIIGLALRDLARAAELVVPGRISRRRIARLLALPELEMPKARPWKRGEGRKLSLENVVIARHATPLTAELAWGETALIDGDPELVRALFATMAGLTNPYEGTVRWNGADLCARRPSQRRRLVGLASDLLPIIPGSNGLNLRYRVPDVSEDVLLELAQTWEIDLQDWLEDPHRLSLVRALVGRPPVLLLAPDERALREEDAKRLAETIGDWPGVVLLNSRNTILARKAARHWILTKGGLSEGGSSEPSRLSYRKERAA